MEKEKPIINVFKSLTKLQTGCSMKELAFSLNVDLRTAYRYKEIIEKIGYQLDKNEATNRYKLKTSKSSFLSLTFSQEEVDYILKCLPEDQGEYFSGIKQKLYINSDIQFIPDRFLEVEFGTNIKNLKTAITEKKRVILMDYNSVNSNRCRDIVIEPIHMEDHYKRLYGFDLEKRKLIQYRTERIGQVKLLDKSHFFTQNQPKKIETDIFWWIIDNERWHLKIIMSRGAFHLLKEEYPRSESFVSEINENQYQLETEVADLRPVASMILRMPGEFEIISPNQLENEIAKKIEKLPFIQKFFKPLT